MYYLKYFIVLAVSVFMIAADAKSQVIIDDFDVESEWVEITGDPDSLYQVVPDTSGGIIIGEERDIVLSLTENTNTGGAYSGRGVNAQAFGGTISYSSDTNCSGSLTMTYDGDDGTATSLNHTGLATQGVGVDLTYGGSDAIGIDVSVYDSPFDIVIDIYTDASRWSRYRQTVTRAGFANFLFSGFTVMAGGGALYNNVGAVVITLDATDAPGIDTEFNILGSYEYDPNLIELVSFTSVGYSDSVTLAWETASEIDNAGFHIWRSDSKDGEYVRITDALIPAKGDSVTGATYVYEDLDARGADYSYQLEDIDYSGVSTFHDLTARYVALVTGWNILDGDAFAGLSVSGALSSIAGYYASVWGLTASGWQKNDPDQPAFSDLETFEAGNDYWLYVTADCDLALP